MGFLDNLFGKKKQAPAPEENKTKSQELSGSENQEEKDITCSFLGFVLVR